MEEVKGVEEGCAQEQWTASHGGRLFPGSDLHLAPTSE